MFKYHFQRKVCKILKITRKDKNISFYSISKIYFLQLYLTRNVDPIPLDMQKSTRSALKPVRLHDISNELQMLCSQKDLRIRYSLDIHLDASQRCRISTVILRRTGLKLIQTARDRALRATGVLCTTLRMT